MSLHTRIVALFIAFLVAQAQPAAFRIETTTLPAPVAGAYYNAQLHAAGGQPPYKWSIVEGALPADLHLDPSGLLVGTPARPGAFSFTARVTDSSAPPQTATRAFKAEAAPSLEVRWIRPPRVENGGIFGSAQVANHLPRRTDLTLIIVGVNEFGKSFVLGYQHAMLAPRTTTPAIPFGFTLPPGSYVVHMDAVGEDPATEALFRARLQTPGPLQVP